MYMEYDRQRAVEYARTHVFNKLYDYRSGADADASAFVARCAGAGFGRELSASGADELYDILLSLGARPCEMREMLPGDVVQLRAGAGKPYKSLIVTGIHSGEPLVSGHSYMALDVPITSYRISSCRCLHIPLNNSPKPLVSVESI